MWFNKKFVSAKQNNLFSHIQDQLANIQSNGVELSMPELIQYQNKTSLVDLSARKNIHGQMSGNYLSRYKGRGMEFDEVRHYQTGDDIRAIDWRVTARTGKTHTKLFREELERPVIIATDLSASMHFGSQLLFKSIQAAHLAALVAWHAKSRGDRLGGIVFNQSEHVELKPRSRKEGVLHYLHALTTLHQHQHANQYQQADNASQASPLNDDYFINNCARLRQIAKPGALVYFITDANALKVNENTHDMMKSNNALIHLSQINQHCELVICLIKDPIEQTLPHSNVKLNVALSDGFNRQQFTLGDKASELAYQEQASFTENARLKALRKTGARVIQLSAGKALTEQLSQGDKC